MANLIEPSSFDLIVLGTGLPQCIVAAAAASNGHSVLHLDTCDFYGLNWASLPLQDFSDWCYSGGQLPFPSSASRADHRSSSIMETTNPQTGDLTVDASAQNEATEPIDSSLQDETESLCMETQDMALQGRVEGSAQILTAGEDSSPMRVEKSLHTFDAKDTSSSSNDLSLPESAIKSQELASDYNNNHIGSDFSLSTMEELGLEPVVVEQSTSMYWNFDFMQTPTESLGLSRNFYIDLAGPKLAYCGEPLVDLLIRCGASNYLEFKSLEASFMWSTNGLSPVPSSRADVFKDRTLSNAEKRHLMRFFNLVVDHTSSNSDTSQISEEELQSPFVDFLQERQVPSSVQAMILYAIALIDCKQDLTKNSGSSMISTREGVESLALYLTSVGRFPNSTGAFLYPLYGQGELPQAFSRCAAVKGALYALKMPVRSLLKDKETSNFKGVQMSTNQLIFSERLVVGPTMLSTLSKGFSSETGQEHGGDPHDFKQHGESRKVVRGICITDKSLRPDLCTIMIVFPPHSITLEENGVIRALQLGSSVSVCPDGKFLVQFSMVCSNESVGIEALRQATKLLFRLQDSSSVAEEQQPTLLWAAFYAHEAIYLQGVKWISAGHIAAFGMPDETLHFQNVVSSAENVYKGLYPADVFFPRPSSSVTDGVIADDEVEDSDSYAEVTKTE